MPYFSEEDIELVKESSDIVDIVSEYIQLKRAGANYKALCPFHNEKTPSLMVSPSKQIFHCFGCGEGGSVINFVMKHLNIEFTEALKLLADRAGIQLKENNSKEHEKRKSNQTRLYDLNREAARYFFNNLKENKKAHSYLLNRGIKNNTIKAFGLGYSYNSWDALLKLLRGKGYSEKEMEEVGLIIQRNSKNGYYDRFRDRIMFPIINTQGNVIGFGGRVLDDSQPKYLNSPESLVFSKGKNLYNLNIAKKFSKGNTIILVEGYMDVIALYNYNIKQCVASLGTALTPEQAKLLNRYGKNIYICYDSDKAGLMATNKAMDIFKELGIGAKTIILPIGKDPDDYIKDYGKESFDGLMDNSLNYINFKKYYYKIKYDINQTEGKIKFTKEMAKILKQIKSPVEREEYIKEISEEMKISFDAMTQEVKGYRNNYQYRTNSKDKDSYYKYRNNNNKEKIIPVKYNLESGHLDAERNLLNLIINDKNIYNKVKEVLTPTDFFNEIHREIANIVFSLYEQDDTIASEGIIRYLQEKSFDKIETVLNQKFQLEGHDKNKAIEDFINTIKRYSLKVEKQEIKKQIKMLSSSKVKNEGDERKLQQLFLEHTKIEKELKLHR